MKEETATDQVRRRVLIVDDDDLNRRLVGKALEFEGYRVELAASGLEGLRKIDEYRPHLVLLDVNMPGLNGLETLAKLRVKDEYTSVVFVSANGKTSDVIAGLDAGADDYVRKPFQVLELLSRVRSQLRIKDLHDNLKRANDRLNELIDIDDLTGLYNMRSILQKIDEEIERGRRFGRSVGIIMMDLDKFKAVNDRHDHLFGSFVISKVGHLIRDNMRAVDFAARYGGDEYLIALVENNEEGGMIFANRLRELIKATTFQNDLHQVRITASLGLAMCEPRHVDVDARQLVRYADRALYNAKERGRDRVELVRFDESGAVLDDGPGV